MEYIISPDGSTVYRITPLQSIQASSLDPRLLPSGFTSTTGSDGSLTDISCNAGFTTGAGGALFEALCSFDKPLIPQDALEWIQVVNTNDSALEASSPYLDNAAKPLQPFYSDTATNRLSDLPPGALNFYDYSRRSPADLSDINPITWNADLYPVIWNTSTNAITVENGLSWGWMAQSATVGTDTGSFVNPAPGDAVVSGVGTDNFSWGSGAAGSLIDQPSSLSFTAASFGDSTPGTPFKLGTLTYFNGTTDGGEASSVEFDDSLKLTNVPEITIPSLKTEINIVTTPNSSDPIASADTLSFGSLGESFNVEEGQTASVDVYATLSTGLSVSPAAPPVDSQFSPNDTLGSNPTYTLGIVGLKNPSTGGFITTRRVTLHGSSSQYIIADDDGSLYIQDTVGGRDGTQTLAGVTEMVFTNGVGIFDPTGTAEDVSRLYYAALNRAPDMAGLEAWTSQIDDSNVPLAAVANAFASSPEFIQDYGSLSNAAFVNQLYQNVLGRPADAAGAQYWDGVLASGASRGAVLVGFAESPENDANTMATAGDKSSAEAYRLYQAALNRAPDQAGLTYWSSALANGATPTQVAQDFINSAEFQQHYGTLNASDFVSTLYENVLHRAADPTGLQYWTNALQQGASEASVLVGFSDGLENRVQTASATHANWVLIPA